MRITLFDEMQQITEAEVQRLLNVIPAWRAEETRRYKYLQGQFCCAKSWEMLEGLRPHFPLKGEANNETDCHPIKRNIYGKPYFEGGPEFSISHCKAGIAVVVNDSPVGIDIEAIDRKISRSLMEHVMNEEECRYIAGDGVRFVELWTKKEALLKKRGTGIMDDMKNVLLDVTEIIETHIEEEKGYVWSVCYDSQLSSQDKAVE